MGINHVSCMCLLLVIWMIRVAHYNRIGLIGKDVSSCGCQKPVCGDVWWSVLSHIFLTTIYTMGMDQYECAQKTVMHLCTCSKCSRWYWLTLAHIGEQMPHRQTPMWADAASVNTDVSRCRIGKHRCEPMPHRCEPMWADVSRCHIGKHPCRFVSSKCWTTQRFLWWGLNKNRKFKTFIKNLYIKTKNANFDFGKKEKASHSAGTPA